MPIQIGDVSRLPRGASALMYRLDHEDNMVPVAPPNKAYAVSGTVGVEAVDADNAETISLGDGVVSDSISIVNDDGANSIYVSFDGGQSYLRRKPGQGIDLDIAISSILIYGANAPEYTFVATYKAVA